MKKLVLVLLIMALTFPVFAQEAKNILAGDILIGGDLVVSPSLTHYTYEVGGEEMTSSEWSDLSFQVSALAGFFLVDSLEIGVAVSFEYSKYKATESGDAVSHLTIFIGPQIGYFFNTYSNLVPYVGAAVQYYSYTYKQMPASGTESEDKENGYLIEPRVGLNLFLSDSIAFAPCLFFQYMTAKEKDSDPENVVKITDFGLRLGFNVFL